MALLSPHSPWETTPAFMAPALCFALQSPVCRGGELLDPVLYGACCFSCFLKTFYFYFKWCVHMCVCVCSFVHVSTVPVEATIGCCLSQVSSEKPEMNFSLGPYPLSRLSVHLVQFLELPCLSWVTSTPYRSPSSHPGTLISKSRATQIFQADSTFQSLFTGFRGTRMEAAFAQGVG